MAKPKIKEKRWTVDLEKKIQEEHFSNKDRYSFNPNSEKEIFVIDTPPPYPSGTWHIGAVAQYSMIDVIARSQRLLGKEVYFPWGVDRNGINIEFTVEKKTGRKMKTYDRAEFLDLCREEIEKYTQEMRNIAKRVGLSCAYDQEYLTDAPDYRSVTQSIFIDLFKKGAIVEELRPNLYDPVEGTTIAEAEVERLSRKSKLLDVRWSVTDDSEHDPVIISTTRPELICACGIVLVHPDDSRYQHLVGKSLDLPMPTEGRSKSVEIIAHPSVNMEFGSGVLMVSSFGDQNDVAVFRELGLSPFQAIDLEGKITELGSSLSGMPVLDARKKAIEILESEDKIENIIEKNGGTSEITITPENTLHFKSECSLLDEETILATENLLKSDFFNKKYRIIKVPTGEETGANCLRINEHLLIPKGYARLLDLLSKDCLLYTSPSPRDS